MSDEQETVLPSYRVSVDNDGKPMVIAADESTRLAIVRLCNYVQQHTAGAAWSDARDVLAAIEAPEFQTEQPEDAPEPMPREEMYLSENAVAAADRAFGPVKVRKQSKDSYAHTLDDIVLSAVLTVAEKQSLLEIATALRKPEQSKGLLDAVHTILSDDYESVSSYESDCCRDAYKDGIDDVRGDLRLALERTQQALRAPSDGAEIVRLEDMLLKRRDVKMERCDGCQRLFEIVNMREYGNDRDESERTYLCAPCAEAEDATTDRAVPCE